MKIRAVISEIELEGDHGPVPSVSATCTRCQYETESYGTEGDSVRRCLVLLREGCPEGKNNFYVQS